MAKKILPPLWEDILRFARGKYWLAAVLLLIGLLGFVIPVIPGIALVILAIALLRKGWMTRYRRRFRLWKTKNTENSSE